MSYTPLVAILIVLVVGATITLGVLFWSAQNGEFHNLKAGAYVIFDDDEPVGESQDHVLRDRPLATGSANAGSASGENASAVDTTGADAANRSGEPS